MPKRNKKQRKSSPKGRGRRSTRKTKNGNSGLGRLAARNTIPASRLVSDETRVSLRYSDQTLFAQGASGGAASLLKYALNGCHICNLTTGAGQPQGWTLLSSMYSAYVVLGSRIRWRIAQQPAGAGFGSLGAVGTFATVSGLLSATMFPRTTGGTDATSVKDASVQMYAAKRFDWPLETKAAGVDAEASIINPRTVWKGRHSMTVQKLDGEENIRNTNYEAAVGANPGALAPWTFYFQDVAADATYEAAFLVEVDVDYDVLLWSRKLVTDAFAGSGSLSVARMETAKGQFLEVKSPHTPTHESFVDVRLPSTEPAMLSVGSSATVRTEAPTPKVVTPVVPIGRLGTATRGFLPRL